MKLSKTYWERVTRKGCAIHSLYTDSGIILASVSDFRSIGEGIIAEMIRPASALGGRRVASIRAGKKWAQARAGVR